MLFKLFLPIAVSLVGFFLIFRLRGFLLIRPVRSARIVLKATKERERRRALTLALAGTLGVGNIFGVAAGIMLGGAGTVFWLLLSSVPAMFIKYAEAALSAKSREAGGGGMHLTLRKSFKRAGATLSATYATLALLLSLSMGAALQSSAFVGITSSIGVAAPIAAVLLLALTLLATFGGKDRISKITEIIIPLTTVIYIIMSFLAIIRAPRPISEVLSQIISEAFRPSSAGGALAFFTSRALCEGFARGMLSNEAGAGTSSLGHTAADGKPHEAGLFGAVEVFFDTTLLCTLTALVILTSVPDPSAFSAPMYLVSAAFSESLGSASLYPLTASVLAFAFSTVICWFYYGREMTLYLSGKSRLLMHVFSLGFYLLVLFGGFLPDLILISVNDVLLLFLTLLTSSVLLLRSPELYQITAESGLLR